MINQIGILFLITFGAVLLMKFARRHLVQWSTVRWMFMYCYYLDRNPIIEQDMGKEEIDKWYHMIGWDSNFLAWWRWTPRSMAMNKELFDKVHTYYKENPPEKAWSS